MTLNTGHVYSCKWKGERNYTFFNVVDRVTENRVYGACIGESFKSGQFEPCDDEPFDWGYDSWANPNNTIIDLGPYKSFYSNNPELFI